MPPKDRDVCHATRRTCGVGVCAAVQYWFGPTFLEAYLRHKRAELATLTDLDPEELCHRYAEVY